MPLTLIPLVLLAVPILEIAVFILVGDLIGFWPTLGLVVASAVLGALLLRRQGLSTLLRIREETAAGRLPARDLVQGAMILVAGILLLTPGLVTDAVGYLLFIPPVRDLAWRFLKGRIAVAAGPLGGFRPGRGGAGRPFAPSRERRPEERPDVVDLGSAEWQRQPNPDSPWKDPKTGRTLH